MGWGAHITDVSTFSSPHPHQWKSEFLRGLLTFLWPHRKAEDPTSGHVILCLSLEALSWVLEIRASLRKQREFWESGDLGLGSV